MNIPKEVHEYLAEKGQRGGNVTALRHGKKHYSKIGKAGRAKQLREKQGVDNSSIAGKRLARYTSRKAHQTNQPPLK